MTLVAASAAVAGAWWGLPGGAQPAQGLLVGGRLRPEGQSLGGWLEQRRELLASQRVRLVHGLEVYETTFGDLGVELDVPATMREAKRVGREGNWKRRWRAAWDARQGLLDVPLVFACDERRGLAGLVEIGEQVRREPVDAYLDLDERRRVPAVEGAELDVKGTLDAVLAAVSQGQDVVAVSTHAVRSKVTVEDLDLVDITKVVAAFETKFHTWGTGAGRAINIRTAAKALDGLVLMPGQSLSFNQAVGPRTVQRGYTYAPEIVGDEMQMGVGGGVCQVASTLYASALHAALQITERWAHGRPSSYTKLGLDATVSYGSKDLRFRNTLPYPVLVHVHVPQPGTLRAEILGGEPVAKVKYRYGVAASTPFVRRIARKPWLASGKSMRKQKGIMGYSVWSVVTVTFDDGRVEERAYHSEYRPTPEIFWVSNDYDEQQLPPLPPGAKGLEGKLADGVAEPSASPG